MIGATYLNQKFSKSQNVQRAAGSLICRVYTLCASTAITRGWFFSSKRNERLADHGLGNSDVYRTLIQSAPSVLDNTQLSVNFDEISSAWRTGTTSFWKKCIRQKMGSVLWRMRLGEGCLGEKGLMKRLRLKGRSSTVCGKRRVCHVHNAACLYRILSCDLQPFVCSSRGRCCQA